MLLATPPPPPPSPSTFAPLQAITTIKSFAGWTAWQDVDAQARRYVIKVRSPSGTVTTRPEVAAVHDLDNPDQQGLPFDLGPDTLGRPSIVVGACAATGAAPCHLRTARLPDAPSRPIDGTAQRQMPAAVTFWRGRLAWSDGGAAVHLRTAPGATPRVVHPWGRGDVEVQEPELDGDLLAGTFSVDDRRGANGTASAVGIANLRTGRRETFGKVLPGEGGQRFTGPAFVGDHTVSWLLTCRLPGACNARFGVYRRDLRTRRTMFAQDRRPHFGFTALSTTTVLLGPSREDCYDDGLDAGRCRIEQRRLTFRSAPR